MVLSHEVWKKDLQKMQQKHYDYMVLDSSHYQYYDDTEVLSKGIDIVNLCNILRMMNDLFEKADIPERIDFSILGEVVIAIYTNSPFNDDQLEKFFLFDKKMEKLARAFVNLSPIMEHVYTPGDIVKLLTGFDLKKQKEFEELSRNEYGVIDEEFYDLYSKTVDGKKPLEEFKKEALDLLENGLIQAKENINKTK